MKKLKMGMIGGGMGSFIGAIHRNAAFLDNCIELACGSFSSDFNNSLETGKNLVWFWGYDSDCKYES